MTNDNLIWLLNWYHNQCDGDWEHENGIKIGTTDNPGWFLKISLRDTELSKKKMQVIDIVRSGNDWLYCSIEDDVFLGFGGVFNLPEVLQIFRNWAESTSPKNVVE
jgi:hypothetical protein